MSNRSYSFCPTIALFQKKSQSICRINTIFDPIIVERLAFAAGWRAIILQNTVDKLRIHCWLPHEVIDSQWWQRGARSGYQLVGNRLVRMESKGEESGAQSQEQGHNCQAKSQAATCSFQGKALPDRGWWCVIKGLPTSRRSRLIERIEMLRLRGTVRRRERWKMMLVRHCSPFSSVCIIGVW